MSNMSHCRFENTLSDFRDCLEWLAENDPEDELSVDELKAAKRLASKAKDYVEMAEDIGGWLEKEGD
jgi:hypothetical protein